MSQMTFEERLNRIRKLLRKENYNRARKETIALLKMFDFLKKGRPPKISEEMAKEARKLLDLGLPKSKVASELNVTFPTLKKALETYQKEGAL